MAAPIEPDLNYKATFTAAMPLPMIVARKLKVPPWQRTKKVLDATTLNDAIRGSDTYVKAKILPGPLIAG